MEITKIETNKEKNFYHNTSNVSYKKYNSMVTKQVVNIYPDIEYQEFLGFGASITESSAYAYSLLPDEKKKEFINDMFGNLNYSLCRLTIGSCDFSLGSYSYANKKDLSDFNIDRDKKYVIPFILDALRVNPNLRFLATPWSPPRFMKNTKILSLGGKLLDKYKQVYADYFVKYIKAYQELGINIDFVTVQNESVAIQIWESCLYSSEEEIDFSVNYLKPSFDNNNLNTKILIYDHNKDQLFKRVSQSFSIDRASKAVSGIAFHWYTGNHFENISLCHEKFPDMLLFHTEGCFGFTPENPYANEYAHDIAEDLNAGTNGYMDWNILLNSKGRS